MKLYLTIAILLCSACFRGEEQAAQVKAGAADVYVWYKTPTQIANTVKNSWELNIYNDEEHKYITSLGPFYGGTDKLLQKATLERPTSGYVLALDLVSAWLSRKLIDVEVQNKFEDNYDFDKGFVFSGGADTAEAPQDGYSCDEYSDNYCYRMDSIKWCECFDGITLGMYNNTTSFSTEHKKRIMHNIQDIGDFFNIAIDNKLYVDANKTIHAAQYLLDEVFIPNLGPPEGVKIPLPEEKWDNKQVFDEDGNAILDDEGNPVYETVKEETLDSDHEAWVKVIYTLMMSGPFYINLQMSEGE